MNRVKYIYHLIAFIYIYNPYTFIHISFKVPFFHHLFEMTLSVEINILHASPSYKNIFISSLFLIYSKYVKFPFTKFMHISLSHFLYTLHNQAHPIFFPPIPPFAPHALKHTHLHNHIYTHTYGIPSN